MKVPRNKIKVNDNYFDIIDTEEKAYMLGLFMADGCLWFDKTNKPHIQLKMTDYDAVNSFKLAIQSEHTIRNEKDGYRLIFRSRKMAEGLISQGCTPRKSLTKTFPKLNNKDLTWSFLFGYIDGNGTISRRGNSVYIIIYTGSAEFANSIKDFYLSQNIGPWIIDNSHNDNTYRVGVSLKDFIITIYNIWDNKNKYMFRKFNKLEQYIKECYGNTEVT